MGDHRGYARSGYAHSAILHQHDIQDNVDRTRRRQKIKRRSGISDSPQDAGAAVVDNDEQNPCKIYAKIDQRFVKYLGARGYQLQKEGGEQDSQKGQNQPQQGRERKGDLNGPVQFLSVARAESPGHDHVGADAHAIEKADNQLGNEAADGHRRQGALTRVIAYGQSIHAVVQVLQQLAKQDRDRERD